MAKLVWLVAVSALLVIAGSSAEANPGLLDLVVAAPQYSTLVTAFKVTNLVPALADILKTSPITVFAPDNAAFARIDPKTLKFLTTTPKGKAILADILKYHVVLGSYPTPHPPVTLKNLAGLPLYITSWYYKLFVNKVLIVKPGLIVVPQGVVHGIKDVLVPPKYAYLFKPKYYYWWWPWY